MSITWSQALAWRLQRHLLEPVGDVSVADVVRRLGAVPSMDQGLAELAVGVRRAGAHPGDVRQALNDGQVIEVFAFRGARHLLSPEDGGAYLALRSAGRQWELPSWQEYYGLSAADWPPLRETVRDALRNGPLTIAELGAAITRRPRYRHLRQVFEDGAGTLIKPLTWQGDLSFGPMRNGRHTFQRLDQNPRWAGVWDLDEAGPHAIRCYFRSYGPATHDHVLYWLGEALSAGRKRLQGWLADLADELVAVDVEGEAAYLMHDDLNALMATGSTKAVHLLPGHDQWVLGPGTKDEHVVPPAHRTAVTRKANLVIADGVVSGTWQARKDEVQVTWFAAENAAAPREALEEQVDRISTIRGRSLSLRLATG